MPQPVENENVTQNSPDGALFGRTSTKLLGFYGATPVARPVTASSTNVSTTSTVSTSTATIAVESWGFASQAEATAFRQSVSTSQYALRQLGLMV